MLRIRHPTATRMRMNPWRSRCPPPEVAARGERVAVVVYGGGMRGELRGDGCIIGRERRNRYGT